ncbi:DUF445 domain-containing protein [Flavobacterium agricola]|uniref:DUF445 domain-containing protein n=1 Tax=Flavobacterium agricola TaxID=2870839 RepID=A0ABY6M0L5_9FLAO|nr:DUF445 domain-containing protein [Flavobacterium agricola]UYW02039.1 DUF445 domain-containing protein [Flavobacterium agricola]
MESKIKNLKKYKLIATSLFVLMLFGFVASTLLLKNSESFALKAIRAFCEAGMVGALADWFAVTALFRKPMGLNIPHTNLIEKNKNDIGKNLGAFVQDNFLTPESINPYIEKVDFAAHITTWYANNQATVSFQAKNLVTKIVNQVNPDQLAESISQLISDKVKNFPVENVLNPAIQAVINQNYHKKALNGLYPVINSYVPNLKPIIKQKISEKAFGFGALISEGFSQNIIEEIQAFFYQMMHNPEHETRLAIEDKVTEELYNLTSNPELLQALNQLKNNLLHGKLDDLLLDFMRKGKLSLLDELHNENSKFNAIIDAQLKSFFTDLQNNTAFQQEINAKIRTFLLETVQQNAHFVGTVIGETVAKWDGREMSEKLELEVGKDLQFIRVNGTLIGGLVGLLLFFISYFIL